MIAEKTEKPLIKLADIEEIVVQEAYPYMQPHEYEILAEVSQGISLPSAAKYQVKVQICDLELKTEKAIVQENTYNRWNQRFAKTVYSVSYQDIYDMGKVFIYLMDGERPVCFAKRNIHEFMDPNPKLQWIELTPDLAIGRVTEAHKAGLISFKLTIHDKTLNGPFDTSKHLAWKKPPQKRPINFKIRTFIYQCRDLPAADSDG